MAMGTTTSAFDRAWLQNPKRAKTVRLSIKPHSVAQLNARVTEMGTLVVYHKRIAAAKVKDCRNASFRPRLIAEHTEWYDDVFVLRIACYEATTRKLDHATFVGVEQTEW